MLKKDAVEAAYCFLHQKRQVYLFSHDARQREDIEYAVESYADSMQPELYESIGQGNPQFLRDYTRFPEQIEQAVERLESLLSAVSA